MYYQASHLIHTCILCVSCFEHLSSLEMFHNIQNIDYFQKGGTDTDAAWEEVGGGQEGEGGIISFYGMNC